MEKNIKQKDPIYCNCANCQQGPLYSYGGPQRFFFLRWFLGLLILAMVFWIGFKIGELKGMIDATFGAVGFSQHTTFDGRYAPVITPQSTTPGTSTSTY